MANEQASVSLHFSDGTPDAELPIYRGTCGPDVIDISQLYKKTGKFTFDPGFVATASCRSNITYIDGQAGKLLYRGYPIEQLADRCNYLEVCYLLLYGELPNEREKRDFEYLVTHHTMVNDQLQYFLHEFRRDAHPMAIIMGLVGAMSAFYPKSCNVLDPAQRNMAAVQMIAKMPTLVAMAYKHSVSDPVIYPRNELTYSENFLHMMFATPCERYPVNPVLARAIDRIFILHADHEQNASTSTVRLCASSGTSPFAAIAAGISCLWGPRHGGANEAALRMLMDILDRGGEAHIGEFISKVKDHSSGIRLMGFGHRVYKSYDPRAKIMRETCHDVLEELGLKNDPLFKVALKLEEIALSDEYFVSRNLYPNVDFYSGIVQKAIGIPVSLFTAVFAMARMVGWFAQMNEMIEDPAQRIGRPRQLYTGAAEREVLPIEERQ